MGGLVQQAGIFPPLVGLPGLQFVEQGVEILTELVQLGDVGLRHPHGEDPLAAHAVGHLGQLLEWRCEGVLHPVRHIEGPQGAEHQTEQHGQQGLQQEQQQILAVPHQVDMGDLHAPRIMG